VLTDRKYQSLCPGLEIGKRLPLETMIRVADCRPFDLQDILDGDAKWRLLVFVGDPRAPGQEDMIQSLARFMLSSQGIFRRLGFKKTKSICEIVTIGAFAGEDKFTYELPDPVKADWTRYAQRQSLLADSLIMIS
jgi:phenol 2-monooxygenase